MGEKKEHLPLHMDRDFSPPLLKALNGLERGSKQLRQFLLRLAEVGSDAGKFAAAHWMISC